MQNKPHHTPIRVANIKKSTNNKCWKGCGETGILLHCLWECSVQSVQFCSVAQSCLTLHDPMDCSTPGFPDHHQLQSLLKLMSIESMMPSSHLVPFSSRLQSFPESGSFQMSQFFTSGGQSIGVSASSSVLPMNTQD